MSWTFPLVNDRVIQVTQSGIAKDQLVQNRFDVLIENISVAVSSDSLISSIQAEWATRFVPLISSQYKHVQTKVQEVLDVIAGVSGPKRVYGLMDRSGPTALNDGADVAFALPYDNAVSLSLVTSGAPGPYWGRKGFGPVSVATLAADGETLDTVKRTAWDTAATGFFVAPIIITGATATWRGVVLPGTEIANLPLPHAALSTLVRDVIAIDVGVYMGSQKTRRVTPNALLGH